MYSLTYKTITLCRAMDGQVLFQDVLAARLNIIKPSKSDVETYLRQREESASKHASGDGSGAPRVTPGVAELIDKLHRKGKIVYLVSGGFRQVQSYNLLK